MRTDQFVQKDQRQDGDKEYLGKTQGRGRRQWQDRDGPGATGQRDKRSGQANGMKPGAIGAEAFWKCLCDDRKRGQEHDNLQAEQDLQDVTISGRNLGHGT